MDWQLLLSLGGVIVFWFIMFLLAIFMTRRALRGVGDPVPEDSGSYDLASANGNIGNGASPAAPSMQESGRSTRGAGDH
jgi:hypothetical protein